MDDAGQKLKQAREALGLRMRDVQEASERIAEKRGNDKFALVINTISEIETRGLVPTLHKLYSLVAIYRLDLDEVLCWYGILKSELIADSQLSELGPTHLVDFQPGIHGDLAMPLYLDPGVDVRRTTFLSRMIQRWGRIPLILLQGMDPAGRRYGYIGTEDRSMYPLLQPGSFVVIDESRRKIVSTEWRSEFERPIWFLQHKNGFACGWCVQEGDRIILIPHPLSGRAPQSWAWPDEVRVIGQVTGVAMHLDQTGPSAKNGAAE